LNATEPLAQGENGPIFSGSDLSTQWLLSGKAVSPPSGTSAAAAAAAEAAEAAKQQNSSRRNISAIQDVQVSKQPIPHKQDCTPYKGKNLS
jgi:hypothetical protein